MKNFSIQEFVKTLASENDLVAYIRFENEETLEACSIFRAENGRYTLDDNHKVEFKSLESERFDRFYQRDFDSLVRQGSIKVITRTEYLMKIIKELRSDLWYQIEAKHGPEVAVKYPSIKLADTVLN